jgi:hypothetical protein
MSTQFYKSLREWELIKHQQNNLVQERLSQLTEVQSTDIDDIKRLAGVGDKRNIRLDCQSVDRDVRMKFIQENNIKPGTPRWFRVMYARPELTGEDPFGE